MPIDQVDEQFKDFIQKRIKSWSWAALSLAKQAEDS